MKLSVADLKERWPELRQRLPALANAAELKKKLQSRTVLALSLETTELSVVVMKREGAEVHAGAALTLPLGADAVFMEPEATGAALAEALEGAGVRERRCVVCVPRRWALTATTEVPEGAGEDLRDYLELQAEKEFAVSPHELQLAHHAYTLPDGLPRATLAALPQKRLEALRKMLEAAGCRAVSVSLGLDRSALLGTDHPSLQFMANCDHVDLIVAAGGGVTAMRTLPGPGERFDAPSFVREVRITIGRLPEALRKGLGAARFSGPPESVSTLIHEMEQPLQRLGIPRVEIEPAGAVAHPAIEAAEHFLRQQPVLFEMVQRETSQWQTQLARFSEQQRRWFIIGVLGLIVLPVLTFMIRGHIANSLDAEWRGMRGEVADLENLQNRIRQFRPWFDPTPQALSCLDALVSCFPERNDVWAKSTQLSETGKVTCTGFARKQSYILALMERLQKTPGVTNLQLQQVRGENPVQFTMIYQWEGKNAP